LKAKRIICLLLSLLFSCALAGCSSSELTKLTLNEVTHSVFYAPQYAAIELGYFEEEGIELDLVNGGGADKSMTALLSGDADIGLMGPETSVYVYNEGKEDHAVVIGQLTQRDGSMLVGREKDENFDWSKLKGKTIIGGRKGGMPEMTLEYVLKQNGLEPGVDVIVDTSVTFDLMAGAFEGSNADYVTLFEPVASLCEREGKGFIVDAVGNESGFVPYTAYMVKKSTLEKSRELYERFMRAVYRGQQWVQGHSAAEIAKLIAPQFPDSDVELLTTVAQNYKDVGVWKTDLLLAKEDFEHMQDIIVEAGVLDQRGSYEAIVDNSLAQKAMK
jgi:NitT/TauT family transport system substrate-binding protein